MPSLFASLALFAYFVAALWQARELAKESGSSRGPALLALPAVLLHAIAHIVSWRASGGIDLHFFTALSLIGLGTAFVGVAAGLINLPVREGAIVRPTAQAA